MAATGPVAKEVVIRLGLDAKGAVTGIRSADGALVQLDRTAKGANKSVGLVGRGLAALKASVVLAGLAAIYGAFRQLGQSVRDAGVQQIAERKLGNALRNLGEDARAGVAGLKETTAELQNLTGVGDEVQLTGLSILGTFKSVSGSEGLKILAPRLLDIAAANRKAGEAVTDLKGEAQALGKALDGGAAGLRRYGVTMTDAEIAAVNAAEGLDRVRLLADVLDANFAGAAEAAADPMVTLKAAIGDLSEEAGGPLRTALTETAVRLRVLAQDPGVVAFVRGLGAAFGWLVTTTVRAMDAVTGGVRTAMVATRRAIAATSSSLASGLQTVSSFLTRVAAASRAIGPLGARLADAVTRAASAAGRGADRLDAYVDRHDRVTAALVAQRDAQRDARRAMDAVLPSVTALSAETAHMGGVAGDAAGGAQDLGEALERVERGGAGAVSAVQQIRSEVDQLATKLRELRAADPAELIRLEALRQTLQKDLEAVEEAVTVGVLRVQDAAREQMAQDRFQITAGDFFGAVGGARGTSAGGPVTADEVRESFEPYARAAAEGLARVRKAIADEKAKAEEEAEAFGAAIEGGIGRGVEALAVSIGEFAVGAASFGDIGRSVVVSLASLAQQVGSMMIGFGVAALGLRQLLTNPVTAIAGGAALIALGAAAKAAIGNAVSDTAGRASAGGAAPSAESPPRPSGRSSSVAAGITLGGAAGTTRATSSTPAPQVTVSADPTVHVHPPDLYLDGVRVNRQLDASRAGERRRRGSGTGL